MIKCREIHLSCQGNLCNLITQSIQKKMMFVLWLLRILWWLSLAEAQFIVSLFSFFFFALSSENLLPYLILHNENRTAASVRTLKLRATIASAPVFRCSERAEKRKEVSFHQKNVYEVQWCISRLKFHVCFSFFLFFIFISPVLLEIRRETPSFGGREKPVWS